MYGGHLLLSIFGSQSGYIREEAVPPSGSFQPLEDTMWDTWNWLRRNFAGVYKFLLAPVSWHAPGPKGSKYTGASRDWE